MKKILTFVLVFALIMSMSVTAFAADNSPHTVTNQDADGKTVAGWVDDAELNADGDNDAEIAVIGKLDTDGDGIPDNEDTDPNTAADVIAVDLSWDAMEWTYSNGHYDANTMTSTSGWTDAEKVISVSNRSNVAITAAPEYKATESGTALKFVTAVTENHGSVDGVIMSLNKATEGTGGENGTPSTGTITVSLDMTNHTFVPTKDDTTLGTITVTIAKVGGSSEVATVNIIDVKEEDGGSGGSYTVAVKKDTAVSISINVRGFAAKATSITPADDGVCSLDKTAQTVTFTSGGTFTMNYSTNPDYVDNSGLEPPLTGSVTLNVTVVE